MSKHFQFESMMSITGSNADDRGMIKPSEQANVLAYLLRSSKSVQVFLRTYQLQRSWLTKHIKH